MNSKILYLFTRTPLHVGAGASVGAIDQPIQRERHTGFPIIPASSLKGSFADQWADLVEDKGKPARVKILRDDKGQPIRDADGKAQMHGDPAHAAWLFGSDTTDISFAGSLIFSEARVLAFPIRSARGSYAWITCPLMLQRAARDGVFSPEIKTIIDRLQEPADTETTAHAIFLPDPLGLGAEKKQIVLEEYCFSLDEREGQTFPTTLSSAIAGLVPDDALFQSVKERLVILSNGMMSHFALTACEVAQHVRISDETGTADGGGLFNQENVPADTLFYSVLSATDSRVPKAAASLNSKKAADALGDFDTKVKTQNVFQFGGDATTGLGFCSATVAADCIRHAQPETTTQPT